MKVLHEVIKVVVGPLQELKLDRFVVKTRELVDWKCVPSLVLYFSEITEGKATSLLRHGLELKRPCGRGMVIGEDILSGQMAQERSLR